MSEHEDFARFRTAIMVCLEPEPAQDALAFLDAMRARQARTIRRLRALADGYRARWTHAIQVKEQIRTFDEMHGAAKERARIVAELRARAKYLIDSYGKGFV